MSFNAFRTLPSKSYASRLLLALTMTMTIGTARAEDKTYVMKIPRPPKMPPQTPMRGIMRPPSKRRPGAASKLRSMRQANSALSRGRSKVRSSAPFNVQSFRRSFSSGSTSALRC
jgi:hypothetical protein